MLVISFQLVPITHLVFMFICWISVFAYIRILYIVRSKKYNEFKSSFFIIIKLHAITDILMFLLVELVARPRKFKIHNMIEPVTDNWLPQLIYFLQTSVKNTMFLGYTVVAANRFSVVFFPKYHNQMWTYMIIALIYSLEWCVPLFALSNMFYNTGNHNFSFLESTSGGLSLRASTDFMKLDALQDFIISTSCFIIICILYMFTAIYLLKTVKFTKVPQNRTIMNSHTNYAVFTSSTEFIIFKCAFFSFLLFIPNAAKTCILYFATDTNLVNIATDLWYFTTELMCISSCWSLLLSSRRLRQDFFPEMHLSFGQSSVSTISGRMY